MESHIYLYEAELITLSPVFIGDGKTIGKQEYCYDRRADKAYLFDMNKLFGGLIKHNLIKKYEQFMMRHSGQLDIFFQDNQIPEGEWKTWVRHVEPVADHALSSKNTKEIQTFIRDPYGHPYIPGSSLKGAFRTMLLCDSLLQDPELSRDLAHSLDSSIDYHKERNRYLSREDKTMDHEIFHHGISRAYPEGKLEDEVNDGLRGLIISDSAPVSDDKLCICQKVDKAVNGENRAMPLLRECIRPGVRIPFSISIDTSECTLERNQLRDAIKHYYTYYCDVFMSKFHDAPVVRGNSTTFFLGGGCGYVSKTGTYAVLQDDPSAVRKVGRILNATLPRKIQTKHGHLMDTRKGVSPHLLKCTRYGGKEYQMGACSLTKLHRVQPQVSK